MKTHDVPRGLAVFVLALLVLLPACADPADSGAPAEEGDAPPAPAAQTTMKEGGTLQTTASKLIDGRKAPATGPELVPVAVGQSIGGALGQGDLELGDGSWADAYVLQANQGQTVVITLQSADFDTLVMVLDAQGNELATNDDAIGTNSRLVFTFPAGGRYLVLANSYGAGEAGAYLLSVAPGIPVVETTTTISPTGDPSDRYAVIIGIGDYPGPDNDLPIGPTQDADLMYRLLVDRFGFAERNILVLKDSWATRDNFIWAIRSHLALAGPNGMALFFYSGHGTQTETNIGLTGDADPEPDNRDEALVAYDALVIDDEIGALMAELSSERVVLIFDSCFSGRASRALGNFPKRLESPENLAALQYEAKPFDWLEAGLEAAAPSAEPGRDAIEMLREPTDHILLASSAEDKLSWTIAELGMSAFTYFLALELLEAGDGESLSQVFANVIEATDNRVPEPQTPQIEGQQRDQTVGYFFLNQR